MSRNIVSQERAARLSGASCKCGVLHRDQHVAKKCAAKRGRK